MSETKASQRFHSLNAEQVEVLDQVLSEVVPIHGRGNFPTLELRPRDIVIAVRARLQKQGIEVRDVRLNGSTASHVLVRDNGTSYKDLDIIFGVELPSQEEFQVIKESVLGCLLDCLPAGVNRERISSATMKEAYVQKMVKVFNEHDRWSLISLSNNSGKNLELKFVSTLRRQFEFSVDSFQIILDRLLESYMQQESQHQKNPVDLKEQPARNQNKDSAAPEAEKSSGRASSSKEEVHVKEGAVVSPTQRQDEVHEKESEAEISQETERSNQTENSNVEKDTKRPPVELKEESKHKETFSESDFCEQASLNLLSEKKQTSEKAEPPAQIELRRELPDQTEGSTRLEQPELTQPPDDQPPAHSSHKEASVENERSNHTKPPDEQGEQPGQPEPLKTSNGTQTEALTPPGECHGADFSECFGEDQRIDETDKRRRVAAADSHGTSSHAEIETQPADESRAETEIGEQTGERKTGTEIQEATEEILSSEAKKVEDTQGMDCSCSTSSTSLTLHNTEPAGTQDTPEVHSTLHSDKSPNALDAVGPPDTQDILPAPPSLVSDKKTSGKASERLSHMVVLKHSSPKPPRRMCRKVAPNSYPGPVSESESISSCLDPNPEAEIDVNQKPTAPISDPTTSGVSTKTNPEPEPTPLSNPASNLDFTSAPDPAPDITPTSALPQGPSSSPLIPESLCLKETPCDEPSPSETASQSEPVDSATQEPANTSEVELSDEEVGEPRTKKTDLNGSSLETAFTSPSSPHCVTPPVSCLTPPVLCLSPPPSPSLSPPPCLTPPSHCLPSPLLNAISPTTSVGSPSFFSPTSSCLSSPPYLTPPMLSLSPPPLSLSPPSPCLSPPLLCLTPPVESEDLVPQVSPDMEPLILNTDDEEQMKESSPQPGVSRPQLEDKTERDYISLLPRVEEPVSFPITIPSSASHAPPRCQSEIPGESAPPNAEEASGSVPENKDAPEVPEVEQSAAPQASGSIPAVEILAESMYGDFEAAMDHLRYRLIATRNPEEIRGGGLLKYSNLLVRDYRPASETQIKTLERYMCSRFFIDFPDVQEQQRKILSYLKNHFIGEERSKYQYLMTLRRVVDDSTVCLMGHERRQTLNMITVLALRVLGEQNIIPNTDHVTCFYQPAPYLADHSAPYLAEPSYCSYYIPQGGSTLLYQPYPLHLHTQTGLV